MKIKFNPSAFSKVVKEEPKETLPTVAKVSAPAPAAPPVTIGGFKKVSGSAPQKEIAEPAPVAEPVVKPLIKFGGIAAKAIAVETSKELSVMEPEELTDIDLASMDMTTLLPKTEKESLNLLPGQVDLSNFVRKERENITIEEQMFIDNLNTLPEVLDDAKLFIDVVGRLMLEMKNNPHLATMLEPEDSAIIFIGSRAAAGLAQVRKQEKTRKAKGAGGSRKKTNDIEITDDVLSGLEDMISNFVGDA